MPLNVGLRSCGALCPHPGCWDAIRMQQKGITKSLPPLDLSSSDDSDSELDLPTQSVCNLLADFGESPTDRYPASTGGRPSHQWESPLQSAQSINKRKEATFSPTKLNAPHNTTASIFSKKRSTVVAAPRPRQPRMPLVEVQEVFDRADLNSQWDETFVTKQYYMWVENPTKNKKKRRMGGHGMGTHRDPNAPILMKDMTECMVPSEIEQQREDTVLFDEWPVLKKKQPRTASPPGKSLQFKKAAMAQPTALPGPALVDVDMDGINELLALPKDVLLKVLENTKKSDFTSKGKLHDIVQECVQGNDSARMMLSTRELLQQKKMKILNMPKTSVHKSLPGPPPKPAFHVDDEKVIDRMSSANTPVKDKDVGDSDDDSSVESFPRYSKPLPKIPGYPHLSYHLVGPGELIQTEPDSLRIPLKAKLPSISLGLPELPSGVKTTRAFTYNSKNMIDFTLGPVISPPTTHRSSVSGDYSEHGTTVKVNAPTSALGYTDNSQAIHSVSPALSTKVPIPPAGTPATFMYPTKSAPNLREITRDPTQMTANLSLRAQPSSAKDPRDTTFLSSPTTAAGYPLQPPYLFQPTSPVAMDTSTFAVTPDDQGLDTIRETAREAGVEGGSVVSSSHGTLGLGDKMDDHPKLVLQTSTMTNINTGASPLPKSARSVESCPSPEQWPLISESSFEKMVPRSSVSEPALSGRSGGRRGVARGLDDNGRDYARKVMVEKNSAESPAPPPPSPEPKDTNEFRARKDTKSRESLSMAPLFEVNEMDEDIDDEERHAMEYDGRRKQVRKIHAVIPQANTDDDENNNRKTEDEKEDSEDEEVMVSQITVMHVAPKGTAAADEAASTSQGGGGNVKREKEKVQETFLNVDIPAEEISSCKAEHGSSRQEDVSIPNDSPAKSEVTTTNSQVSATTASNSKENENDENDGEGENGEYEERKPVGEEGGGGERRDYIEGEGKDTLDERQYLDMQSDFIHQDRNDSAKLNSEESGTSPELVCDSARFMSHDLVSPIEGEMDEGQLQMMSLLQQVEGRSDVGLGETMTMDNTRNETEEQTNKNNETFGENDDEQDDADDIAGEYGKILDELEDPGTREIQGEESRTEDGDCVEGSGAGKDRQDNKNAESNETPGSDDLEPPGSFFFQNNGGDTQGTIDTGTFEFNAGVFVSSTTTEEKDSGDGGNVEQKGEEEEDEKLERVGAAGDVPEEPNVDVVDTENGGVCVNEGEKSIEDFESGEIEKKGDGKEGDVEVLDERDSEKSKDQLDENVKSVEDTNTTETNDKTVTEGDVDCGKTESGLKNEEDKNADVTICGPADNDNAENGEEDNHKNTEENVENEMNNVENDTVDKTDTDSKTLTDGD